MTIDATDSISSIYQAAVQPISKGQLWAGRILSGVLGLFFFVDGGAKLFKPVQVVQTMTQLGYPDSTTVGIGLLLIVCTVLYLIPRTAFWGAILLSAYLGGAVATNVRAGAPAFNVGFPVFFGFLVWIGLYLQDSRLRTILT